MWGTSLVTHHFTPEVILGSSPGHPRFEPKPCPLVSLQRVKNTMQENNCNVHNKWALSNYTMHTTIAMYTSQEQNQNNLMQFKRSPCIIYILWNYTLTHKYLIFFHFSPYLSLLKLKIQGPDTNCDNIQGHKRLLFPSNQQQCSLSTKLIKVVQVRRHRNRFLRTRTNRTKRYQINKQV